jgi:signal transduction histidine kinase
MKNWKVKHILGGIIKSSSNSYHSYRPASGMLKVTQNFSSMTELEKKLEEQRLNSNYSFTSGIDEQLLDKRPGILATALVHEVRNPLTNINLAAEIIGSGTLDEEQKAFVEIITRGVERISNLLTDFLSSYKINEKHAEICSLNELVDDVLALNKDRLNLKDVFIIKQLAYTDWKILVIKNEIIIALTNIIINAIEAMPEGSGTLKLKTGLLNDTCFVQIEDNGIGISETNLEKIFNPYYTNKPGGMGLGLSTTLDILLSNCGTLEVKSELGSGTQFNIYFNKTENE